MRLLIKGIRIGIGLGIAVYVSGFIKDYKERIDVQRERDAFGNGE